MKKNLLAAIIGAVSAYIEQEESNQVALNSMTAWWLRGQREQMRLRTDIHKIKQQPGVSVWHQNGLEEAMAVRTRLIVKKQEIENFYQSKVPEYGV